MTSIYKNPLFWIAISILIVVIAIYVISRVSNDDRCPPGEVKGICEGRCVVPCVGGKYNCETDTCECSSGTELCGSSSYCCPKDKCHDGQCCDKARQCPIGPDGATGCCPSDQGCLNNECVEMSGVKEDGSGNFCGGNTPFCLSVGNLNEEQKERFKKDFPEAVFTSDGGSHYFGYACTESPSCNLSNQKSAPSSIDSIYPCTNIFDDRSLDNRLRYCTSDDASKAKSCWLKHRTDCTEQNGCTFRYPLETDISQVNADIKNIQAGQTYEGTYHGNWCGEDGHWQLLSQIDKDEGNCTAQDCWSQLGKKGVSDVYWDGNSCRSITNCVNSNPSSFVGGTGKDLCGGKENENPICSNDLYRCQNDGSIVDKPPSGWVPEPGTSELTFNCIEGEGTSAKSTKKECIDEYCSKNSCCNKGFKYFNGRCFQASPPTETFGDQCSSTCKPNKKASCGNGWRPCTQGDCFGSCSHSCCNKGTDTQQVQGGGKPKDAKIPYCICKIKSPNEWGEIIDGVAKDGGCWVQNFDTSAKNEHCYDHKDYVMISAYKCDPTANYSDCGSSFYA